jgi:hypothetical protein
MTLSFINANESLGTTVQNVLKGAGQLAAGVLDKSLDPAQGVTDLGALAIMLTFLAIVIVKIRTSAHHVQSAF